MARIAFFSERLDSDPVSDFSFELMLNLSEQQHDVSVFTTFLDTDQGLAKSGPRLQIMRPFKKWNWLELPRLMPVLAQLQPEILHFIEPRHEAAKGWTSAMKALPGLAPLIGRPKIVFSIYELTDGDLKPHEALLAMAHAITASTKPQAELVRKWLDKQKIIKPVALIAPTRRRRVATEHIKPMTPALDSYLSNAGILLLVPGDISDHVSPLKLFEFIGTTLAHHPDVRVLFAGGWGRIPVLERQALMHRFDGVGARVLLSGPLDPEAESQVLGRASLVLTASLNRSSLTMARWNREALDAGVPLMMSDEQAELDPLAWQDRVNCFIVTSDLSKNAAHWGASLSFAITDLTALRSVRARLKDFNRSETIDQPANLMSRIYAQVLRGST